MGVSQEAFRAALRKFASGITVVTVSHDGHLHGMTASSFSSVSLDPPLVLVCLAQSSRTRELVEQAGYFAVNILASEHVDTARAFARTGTKPFDTVGYAPGEHGAPLLDAALASLECRTVQVHEAGDHDVVVAAVEACTTRDGAPLLYFDGAYRSLDGDDGRVTRDPRTG